MFIIDNHSAYLIQGDKARKIKFNYDMTYTLTDETLDDISKYVRYTLREIKAKLNVKHNLQKHLINKANSGNAEEIAALNKELEECHALIEELKKELENKEQELQNLTKENKEEEASSEDEQQKENKEEEASSEDEQQKENKDEKAKEK